MAEACQTDGAARAKVWRGPIPGELRAWGSSSLREGQGKGWNVAETVMERPGAARVGGY